MASINTNANSFILANLRQIGSDLTTSQNRISTGLKVASARDNASVWSTAQTIRKEVAATENVKDGLTTVKAQVEIANQALSSMSEVITKMQTAAAGLKVRVTGSTGDANGDINDAIQKQLAGYQAELLAISKSASFNGKNYVGDAAATITAVVGKSGSDDITITLANEQILGTDGLAGTLFGSNATFAAVYGGTGFAAATVVTAGNITSYTGALTAGLKALSDYGAKLTNFSDSITAQQTFMGKINDIRNKAISSLVDADMEVESAKISALQVKEQLSYQALSISNQSSQNVLSLFR